MGSMEMNRQLIYEVDRSGKLMSLGEGWVEFARENGWDDCQEGDVLGRLLLDFVDDATIRHLIKMVEKRVRDSGIELNYQYRCDSPDRKRYMEMVVSPVADGGILYKSTILKEVPRSPIQWNLVKKETTGLENLAIVCSYCLRFDGGEKGWMEVEEMMQLPDFRAKSSYPDISHGMCPDCYRNLFDPLED